MEKHILTSNEVDLLVTLGQQALVEYEKYDQAQIDRIVAKVSVAAIDAHGMLAKMAI